MRDAVQMAAGLGPDFNLHARGLTVVLLDKLKDTNRAVVDAVQTCLDTFLQVQTCLDTLLPPSCLAPPQPAFAPCLLACAGPCSRIREPRHMCSLVATPHVYDVSEAESQKAGDSRRLEELD